MANQVRLALFVLAYNLGNLLRRLGLPKAVKDWSLPEISDWGFESALGSPCGSFLWLRRLQSAAVFARQGGKEGDSGASRRRQPVFHMAEAGPRHG